jgi:hypothetical protein
MMKKQFAMLAFMALISLMIIMPKPAEATIAGTPLWTNPARRSYTDGYYGTVNIAYDRDATAVLLITIRNNRGSDAYFLATAKMDWDTNNITSTDYMIKAGESHAFETQITIPSNVSNLYMHTYTVYSQYRYAPDDSWSIDDLDSLGGFVVYSPEQSTANSLIMELNAYPSYSYAPFLSSAKAKELVTNASLEKNLGDQSYARADFTAARDHYQKALDNTEKAFTSDTDYLSNFENTLVGLVNAGQTFLSFQGWAFFVAAIGFLLMGVGVIVYLIRRSKPPVPT